MQFYGPFLAAIGTKLPSCLVWRLHPKCFRYQFYIIVLSVLGIRHSIWENGDACQHARRTPPSWLTNCQHFIWPFMKCEERKSFRSGFSIYGFKSSQDWPDQGHRRREIRDWTKHWLCHRENIHNKKPFFGEFHGLKSRTVLIIRKQIKQWYVIEPNFEGLLGITDPYFRISLRLLSCSGSLCVECVWETPFPLWIAVGLPYMSNNPYAMGLRAYFRTNDQWPLYAE